MRTYDVLKVVDAVGQYAEEVTNFYPVDWLNDKSNVALVNSNDDVALFERTPFNPFAVYGHYFFWSRGKDAFKVAKDFLTEIFTTNDYNVHIILGLTPLDHKGALWMNKQLGFKTLDTFTAYDKEFRIVMLTKKEWEQSQ